MYNFQNMNAVITGATRGLGKATAIALTRLGANIALLGRDQAALKEMASTLPKNQVIAAVAADLSQPNEIKKVYHALFQEIAHIDLLINNAAGWLMGTLEKLSDEEIAHTIATTVTGSILITKHLIPLLKIGAKPHIVNIISTAGMPNYQIDTSVASVPYFAAKWGQAGFSEALRDDLKKEGIKISTVYPGAFVNSSSLDDALGQYGPNMLGVREVVDAILFCLANPTVHSITVMA